MNRIGPSRRIGRADGVSLLKDRCVRVSDFGDVDELRGPSVNVRCGSGTDLRQYRRNVRC